MPGAAMYRVPTPRISSGGGFSVILDRGELRGASRGGECFLFSEAGAGVESLVLIGTLPELKDWSDRYAKYRIENRISELPEIYMGMCPYVPGKRFKGLFPVNDFVVAMVHKSAGIGGAMLPSGVIGSLGEGLRGESVADIAAELIGKGIEGSKRLRRSVFGLPKKPQKDLTFYVKINYLQEDDMHFIGNRVIQVPQLFTVIRETADTLLARK
ncbi:hypothetical protein GCM10011363_45290 [Marivita lacus]|uniref:Uncharacterized protein n=1 Tax=Marivita lacus TaxID=1323742 RepID=A0ABQ1LH88_9RHOB|nr:hypothetical protein [Marivita lacus]GGC23695.1 hypothetical protein GCM10011363_45290 [Marivita lacus]